MTKRLGAAVCLLAAAVSCAGACGANGKAARSAFIYRSAEPNPQDSAEPLTDHTKVSEQSLLIRDPRVLDSAEFDSCPTETEEKPAPCNEAKGKWSFAQVFRRGMAVGGKTTPAPPDVQTAIDAWRKDLEAKYDPGDGSLIHADSSLNQTVLDNFEKAWGGESGGYPASRIPVRLLAIVNRIDTAVPDLVACASQGQADKDMSGSEIRFEFAGVQAQVAPAAFDYLRIIVEFVLPCQSSTDPNQFPRLARDWYSLSTLDIGSAAYRDKLSQTLDYWVPRAAKARVRIAGASAGSNWTVREYVFQPDGNLVGESLERDLPGELAMCWPLTSPLGRFASGHDTAIRANRYEFTERALSAREQSIKTTQQGVLGLDRAVAPGGDLEKLRHALSINTCRGCHTTETGTNGLHLGQRTKGKRSQISGFLSGASSHGWCTGGDGDGDAQSYCAPRIVTPEGCPAGASATPYHYNDLLRRHLYLDTVVNPPKGTSPGARDWYSKLIGYASLQIH